MDSVDEVSVIGTRLAVVTYESLWALLQRKAREGTGWAIEFANTHVVTQRRAEPSFEALTRCFDLFIPDGMPLIWAMNRRGARLKDRVYGPTFMRVACEWSPASVSHFFLGGSEECNEALRSRFQRSNPDLTIAGFDTRRFRVDESSALIDKIADSGAELVWVGLGTPKQQQFIAAAKAQLPHCLFLSVGFAFDVNAGTKPDAPLWMQRLALTWLFRMASEPRRLLGRYLKWNTLFLAFLLHDALRGGPPRSN